MTPADPFGKWLDRFADLSDADVFDLPEWQQALVFIHQFSIFAASDGAGSLFYNYPENIEHVAEAFATIGEPELAGRIEAIQAILEPFSGESPFNESEAVLEQCLNGAATAHILTLDAQFQKRCAGIYDKLEARARANGWAP